MNFDDVKEYIQTSLDSCPEGQVNIIEAEKLALKFLLVKAKLVEYHLKLDFQKNAQSGVVAATYKQAIFSAEGKNAPEKTACAEAAPMYTSQKELLDNISSQVYYLRMMEDVFNNLHIFYRNLGKYGV